MEGKRDKWSSRHWRWGIDVPAENLLHLQFCRDTPCASSPKLKLEAVVSEIRATHQISAFSDAREILQESRAVARKRSDAAAVLFGLKFADKFGCIFPPPMFTLWVFFDHYTLFFIVRTPKGTSLAESTSFAQSRVEIGPAV